MPSPSEWRPDLYVLSRILDRLWTENGPMLRTRLQVASNTSYDNLVRYISWMREKGLVTMEMNDGHEMVALTEKGRDAYRRIVLWISETF